MHNYNILEKGKPLALAKNAIILLHGRGASAEDIIGLADVFVDDTFYIAAPQASNGVWYPYSFMEPEKNNEPWLDSAIQTIKRLIDEVKAQIGVENLYIMGFSQGACLALETTTRHPSNYAGIAAFSGGLIGQGILPEKYHGTFPGTKIFIGCSENDPHIPRHRCEESYLYLQSKGADVTLDIYPGMSHTITLSEIETVKTKMFI